MSRHLVWLVLAISVVFNIGFAAAYLTARSSESGASDGDVPSTRTEAAHAGEAGPDAPARLGADPGVDVDPRANGSASDHDRRGDRDRRGGPEGRGRDGRIGQVAGLLGLDEDQQAYFRALHQGMAQDEAIFEVAIGALREELAEAYDAPQEEATTLRSLREREAELVRQRHLARTERLEAFMTVLSPEQLERFRSMLEKLRAARPEFSEQVAEFDRNGDGQLDLEEIAALRTRMNERLQERTEATIRRERELRGRFDADGDGRLDRGEREAARRWEIVRRYDADGDGELDEAEQAVLDADRVRFRQRMDRGRGDRRGGSRRGQNAPSGREGEDPPQRGLEDRGDRTERGDRRDRPNGRP